MAQQPDSFVMSEIFQPVSAASIVVTPTGGTQAALGDILGGTAAVGGAYGPLFTTADTLTAHAGGGQSAALLCPAAINRFTVVATAADSVKLPRAVAGREITIINDAASNAMQVFGTTPDTIDAVATGTGVALSAAKRAIFSCVTAGAWISLTGAKAT